MILINDVYNLVADLISKDKSGYISNAEFNWRSKIAEEVLWDFYASRFEMNESVPDSLFAFITEQSLPIVGGLAAFPTDYGRRLNLWFNKVTNADCGAASPNVEKIGMYYLEKSEEQNTVSSVIRGPSLAKGMLYWTEAMGQIRVYPSSLTPSVVLEYVKYPTYGVRGVTLDVANDQENYDPATTTNYMWRDQDQTNLIDLIMLQYGVSNGDNEVIQFAATKSGINKNIVQNTQP